jgi:hypothetical protein
MMDINTDNYFNEITGGVVDYFWNAPPPSFDIDHSARQGALNRLISRITSQIGNLSREDSYKKIMTILEENKEFCVIIEDVIEFSIDGFEKHYIKYGGKSGLFAYCLLLSLGTDKDSNLFKAKASLLNWYAEERKLSRSVVNGDKIGAWWPFEWFSANFDSIAAGVIASIIFSATGKMISKIRKAFKSSYQPIKKSSNPYPQAVLMAKSHDQTIADFDKSMQEAGLVDQFLYIFKLNNKEIEQLIEDWAKSFIQFKDTLNSTETSLVMKLLEGPVIWSNSTKGVQNLRARQIIKLVEPNPNELWISLYPRIFAYEK